MKRIIVVSDTHGNIENLAIVLERIKEYDLVIHLGDSQGQEDYIRRLTGGKLKIVKGNCDFNTKLNRDELFEIDGHTIFITHGDRYYADYGTYELIEAGRERGAEVVMYGHTHVPLIEESDGITIINPGSLSRPRQDDYKYTYIIMEEDRFNKLHYTLCSV